MREAYAEPIHDRLVRMRYAVLGRVQGVGFRPRVCVLARTLGVTGFVGNDAGGVFVEVQGTAEVVGSFLANLRECPQPVHVEAVKTEELPLRAESDFVIAPSEGTGVGAVIPPDITTCSDCLRELNDPADRQFSHPFITCARCGPRFTLIREMPFDRVRTAMGDFETCPTCTAEYSDPNDRRFHAQSVACPSCGPRVWFVRDGRSEVGATAIERAREALASGLIVAAKGVGGFHLACDATNDASVRRLRAGKGRGDKPFAIMAASVRIVREDAEVSPQEERFLTAPERPVVLLRRLDATTATSLSQSVAPGNNYLGLMLPYSPLHHLLLGDRPLVMTSANVGGEPIVTSNENAAALQSVDAYLYHDREIVTPCDDSVVRVFESDLYPIRRS